MVELGSIEVEVVYALPKTQTIVPLVVPVGTTVGEVLSQSGMAARHPEIDIYSMRLGIYGKRMSLTTVDRNLPAPDRGSQAGTSGARGA